MLVDREADNSELVPEVVITIKTHYRKPFAIQTISQSLNNLLNSNKVFKHMISLLSLSLSFSSSCSCCCCSGGGDGASGGVCVNGKKFQSKCKSESQCDG